MRQPPLILSLDYPPNDGGISRLASGLVAALAAQGYAPDVVTFAADGRAGPRRPAASCTEVSRRKGLRDIQILRTVRSFLRTHGSSAPILATLWNPEATLAFTAGARRVSILAHGNEVMAYPRSGLKARIRRAVLEHARVVICNSRFTEGLVKQIAPGAGTAVLNPAVDAAAFAPPMPSDAARRALNLPAEARIVLTVARLDPIKGHETVLRALAELSPAKCASLLYVIVGKGEMRGPLEAMARDLGVLSQVRFAGFVADADLPVWYAAADLFVLPSFVDPLRRGMEGFGMALTEAQAAGLPVIGTRSGGIPDAICENEGGWLIEPRDAGRLASHLLRLVEEPEAMRVQGSLGAERVRRCHGWASYAERLASMI